VIHDQLNEIKEILNETSWENVIIAYEPIWALNTGKISSLDQTQEGADTIRYWLRDNAGDIVAN
jgi:triosephosphate isomerase